MKSAALLFRHALYDLEAESLVVKLQGRGTYVKPKQIKHGENAKGFMQSMAEQGYVITTRILVKELITAPKDVLGRLHLGEGEKVWHFRRLRSNGKHPIVLMEVYVPKDLGDEMQPYDLENISFYKLYREIRKCDIMDTPCTVTACIPSDDVCDLLCVDRGSAHLYFRSTAYMGSTPIEYNVSFFNANYMEFVVGMRDQRIHTLPKD